MKLTAQCARTKLTDTATTTLTHSHNYNYTHTHTQIYTVYAVHTYTRAKCAENVKETATREHKQSKAAQ